MYKDNEKEKEIKNKSFLHNFADPMVLLFTIIVFVGILTYFIPAGKYETIALADGKSAIDPKSFHYIESTPLKALDFFKAIPQGLAAAGPLVFMVFLIGGAISLFDSTGAISGCIAAFARRFGKEKSSWVLVIITTFFMSLGAFPGMLEAAIPFAPLCIGVALSLGYDVVVGMSIAVIGISTGYTAGVTNPWTTGIGQTLAGLPMFSGFGFRIALWVVFVIVSNAWILRYASIIKKDPTKSIVYGIVDNSQFNSNDLETIEFTNRKKGVLAVFVVTIATIVYGSLKLKFGIPEMSAVYIIGACIGGVVAGYSAQKISETIMEGGRSIFVGAMAVGVARGISVVMENTNIVATIVHFFTSLLQGFSPVITSWLIFIVQSVLNLLIPSGSGCAMVSMPIMLPLGELLHVNKQITVLAFQFGDGLTNLLFPTVALVISYIAYTKIPFTKWVKHIFPFVAITYVIALATLAIAVLVNFS